MKYTVRCCYIPSSPQFWCGCSIECKDAQLKRLLELARECICGDEE